jgi:hypothetical protein
LCLSSEGAIGCSSRIGDARRGAAADQRSDTDHKNLQQGNLLQRHVKPQTNET